MTSRSWLAAIGVVLAQEYSCASTRETPDRYAALDARISRLEALLRPAAVRDATVDGLADGPADGGRDASLTFSPPAADAQAPSDPELGCMANAERSCAQQVEWQHVKSEPAEGGFAWSHAQPVGDAGSNPTLRACLARARAECAQQKKRAQRGEALFVWLEAQLTPDRIDPAASTALRDKLEKQRLVAPGTVDVVCTTRFCRITPKAGTADSGIAHVTCLEDSCSRIATGSASYVTRKGYRFPQD